MARSHGARADHPLRRMELCSIPRQGRVSAAVACFVHGILGQLGRRPALLTPEGGWIAGRLFPQRPTRDEAPEWERLLATHVRWGGDCLVIEEDPEIVGLLEGVPPRARIEPSSSSRIRIRPQALHWRGTRLQISGSADGSSRTAHLPLVGSSNIKALETALDLVLNAGFPLPGALAALPLLENPPGLLEPVQAGQPFGVFVDRASSAEELDELLIEARAVSGRRILLVAGLRGASSPEERHALGAVCARADEVVFTSDNPRHESPAGIIDDLQRGLGGRALAETDRHEAIRTAIRMAKADDLVLVIGKGGRPVQEVGSAVIPWDDRLHARDALAGRGWVGDSL